MHEIKVKVVKNKVGKPWKEASFPLIYDKGVDLTDEIVQISIILGIVYKSGAWISYRDENNEIVIWEGKECKWNGKAKMVEFLKENPSLEEHFNQLIRNSDYEGDNVPEEERTNEDGY